MLHICLKIFILLIDLTDLFLKLFVNYLPDYLKKTYAISFELYICVLNNKIIFC